MSRWIKGLNEEQITRDLALGFRQLRFSSSLENVYQQYFYQWLTKRARPIGWFSLAIFLSYSLLDYRLFPDFVSQWTISIRLFLICPLILILIWLSYQPLKPRLFFAYYGVSYFLSGLAIVAIIMSARFQQVYMPYDGLLLVMMYGYFVMKVPFYSAIAASWLIFLTYLIVGGLAGIPQQELIYNSSFLITANIIGGVGSYLQEHSQRTHFLGQLLLEFAHETAEIKSEQKTKLIATASHELRQPLHAMNLLAENLSGELGNSQQQDTMSRLQLSILQLQDLLGSLFDISRLSIGVIKPRKKEVDCSELINSLVTEYRPRCDASGIILTANLPQHLFANTDPLLLTRILRNLLENALKHSQATELAVTLNKVRDADQQDAIEINVIDNGVGIEQQDQEDAFKEFNSLARHGGGLGVGLAVVKQLTAMQGISLTLISSKNTGCQFRLLLPVGRPLRLLRNDEIRDKDLFVRAAKCENEKIKQLTIVDDDREILASMAHLITGWHYQVSLFDSPSRLLNAVQAETPDAIIVDYQFLNDPDTNGVELIQRLRQHYGREVPALLLSANTELDLDAAVSGNTVVAYKPLKPAKLKLILSHLTAKPN
ncbi:ATP-binding response regulator [Alkalimarinus alittae]|uniref:histidine kinase n=1 Tax=Alkalimarinus alittae TaxID=2961619 RepID=A0ABY6N1W0_9ALTE|nr:hybrid sensor histidine kinase/response regulator [Alkalimarinus alittae]UZE96039.1 hybrid sensor histidine kinase/response regulator [Alkalimarinus alittae]